ncbi:b2748 [Wigglesworthia glossinidia endosymbiont of Glossina brevipalpis]|uniref:Cell division protein FtsB n=1 Tax=Wigglesworthia glossinidia brevipalpis TaxID=36870 RepID=Q8D222_WIGBR|nr:b2748 [Wigglesworthia glossinidia endosymbiont of Glossina brevipalpis]
MIKKKFNFLFFTKFEFLLVFILLFMQFYFWFGNNNIITLIKIKKEIKIKKNDNLKKKLRNNDLLIEIEDLRNTKEIIEEKARSDLNMIKSDEIYYRIINLENKNNYN